MSGAEHAVQAWLCDRSSDVCCDGMLSASLSSPVAWPCAGAGGVRTALLAILCSRPHQVCILAAAPTVQGLLQVPAPQCLQLQQQQGLGAEAAAVLLSTYVVHAQADGGVWGSAQPRCQPQCCTAGAELPATPHASHLSTALKLLALLRSGSRTTHELPGSRPPRRQMIKHYAILPPGSQDHVTMLSSVCGCLSSPGRSARGVCRRRGAPPGPVSIAGAARGCLLEGAAG